MNGFYKIFVLDWGPKGAFIKYFCIIWHLTTYVPPLVCTFHVVNANVSCKGSLSKILIFHIMLKSSHAYMCQVSHLGLISLVLWIIRWSKEVSWTNNLELSLDSQILTTFIRFWFFLRYLITTVQFFLLNHILQGVSYWNVRF